MQLSLPTISNLSGGTDDYAVTAGELEIAYDRFEDTESLDVNLIIGGKGGGSGDTQSTQDTHVTMLTALSRKEKRLCCICITFPFCNCRIIKFNNTNR